MLAARDVVRIRKNAAAAIANRQTRSFARGLPAGARTAESIRRSKASLV